MSLHKATAPRPDDPTKQNCVFCHRTLTRVPGGNGPVWIHPDGHVTAGPSTIDQMYAFVAVEEHGEGIIGGPIGDFMIAPYVSADEDHVDSLREQAREMGRAAGLKIKLVKFTTRTELEEVYTP